MLYGCLSYLSPHSPVRETMPCLEMRIMRKLLILTTLAMFAVSAAGCNHCRQSCCGRGFGGGAGGGLFGGRSANYGYGGDDCCCESGGEVYGDGGGMMVSPGAPCCN